MKALVSVVFLNMFVMFPVFSQAIEKNAHNLAIQNNITDIVKAAAENDREDFIQKANALKENMGGHRAELCRQILIFMTIKHDDLPQRAGWSVFALYNSMKFSADEKTEALIPLISEGSLSIDGPGDEHLGRNILREIDMPNGLKGNTVFSSYAKYLSRENIRPEWLISYMYEKDPVQAITVLANMELSSKAANSLVQSISASPVEISILKVLIERPEWWAHLYVATMMEKKPNLRTPGLMEKLEQDTHPLVQEKISIIKSLMLSETDGVGSEE